MLSFGISNDTHFINMLDVLDDLMCQVFSTIVVCLFSENLDLNVRKTEQSCIKHTQK